MCINTNIYLIYIKFVLETITVPRNLVGRLIGRRGETIAAIRQDSGANCHVDKEVDEITCKVLIKVGYLKLSSRPKN